MIKINSTAPAIFAINGVKIYPGTRKYNLDPKERNVAYQLKILLDDGVIKCDCLVEFDAKKKLPFDPKEEKKEAEAKAKAEKEAAEKLTSKKLKLSRAKDSDK